MKKLTPEMARVWFDKNYTWLRSWLKHTKESKTTRGQQVFFTSREYRCGSRAEVAKLVQNYADRMLLFHLVFSKKVRIVIEGGSSRYYLEGFLEQKGRLPTKKDKIVIRAYEFFAEPVELDWNSLYIRRICKLEVK